MRLEKRQRTNFNTQLCFSPYTYGRIALVTSNANIASSNYPAVLLIDSIANRLTHILIPVMRQKIKAVTFVPSDGFGKLI